jgi:hypothetical protein
VPWSTLSRALRVLQRHQFVAASRAAPKSAIAQLVEQRRILDGDDGLGGEALQHLDLLVAKRAATADVL